MPRPGLTIENSLLLRSSNHPLYRQQLEQHILAPLRRAGIPER